MNVMKVFGYVLAVFAGTIGMGMLLILTLSIMFDFVEWLM